MRGRDAKYFSILFSIDSITKLATITEIENPSQHQKFDDKMFYENINKCCLNKNLKHL